MPDHVSSPVRSKIMTSVRTKGTAPELIVRGCLYSAGYRYRLHQKRLPGNPDIVLRRFKTAIFVHGCFWHGHQCPRGKRPTSNVEFWSHKLDGNIARDKRVQKELTDLGWNVVIIWSCSVASDCEALLSTLSRAKVMQRVGEIVGKKSC